MNEGTHNEWDIDGYIIHLEQCISWLEDRGVKLNQSSRYPLYLGLLNQFKAGKFKHKRKFHGGVSNIHDVVNALRETRVLNRVKQYLYDYDEPSFIDKLVCIVNGPTHSLKESTSGGDSGNARNILLELTIGAEFVKYGFDVSYGNDNYPEPLVTYKDVNYPCQCKRLLSVEPAALERNINDASEQLRKNIGEFDDSLAGIIVLDVSRLLENQGNPLIDIDTSNGRLKSLPDLQLDNIGNCVRKIHSENRLLHVSTIILTCNYMRHNRVRMRSPVELRWDKRLRVMTSNSTDELTAELVKRQNAKVI